MKNRTDTWSLSDYGIIEKFPGYDIIRNGVRPVITVPIEDLS